MLSKEDLNYLEWVVNSSDDNRAWDILQTLKAAVLAQETNNTGSPKLADTCDHHFVGNDYLCKKCGLYFPETNT